MFWNNHIAFCKHGSGNTERKSKNPARKVKRTRSRSKLSAKKDRNVTRSSNGKFKSVEQLEKHRLTQR